MKQSDKLAIAAAANVLRDQCYQASKDSGWWTESPDATINAVKIALIHSEISEALEGVRKGKQDDHLPHRTAFEVELADAIIRICDLAGANGLDLGGAVAEKMEYNRQRADHKLENRQKEGGKKF